MLLCYADFSHLGRQFDCFKTAFPAGNRSVDGIWSKEQQEEGEETKLGWKSKNWIFKNPLSALPN